MTRKDAVQFLMGFIMGVASTDRARAGDKSFAHKALNKGIKTLMNREDGFFNALERVVEEELTSSGFNGDMN